MVEVLCLLLTSIVKFTVFFWRQAGAQTWRTGSRFCVKEKPEGETASWEILYTFCSFSFSLWGYRDGLCLYTGRQTHHRCRIPTSHLHPEKLWWRLFCKPEMQEFRLTGLPAPFHWFRPWYGLSQVKQLLFSRAGFWQIKILLSSLCSVSLIWFLCDSKPSHNPVD